MTSLDMLPLQADFDDQEQAEEAIRKLASLRADRFRMERGAHGPDFGSARAARSPASMNKLAGELLADARVEAAQELGAVEPSFSLSVQVPTAAMEQARKVIETAGGRCF